MAQAQAQYALMWVQCECSRYLKGVIITPVTVDTLSGKLPGNRTGGVPIMDEGKRRHPVFKGAGALQRETRNGQ